jgi:hypothetical protein
MPVRIKHDFDDAGIFQIAGDRWSEGGLQHARAAQESFRSEGERRHSRTPCSRLGAEADVSAGSSRKSLHADCATTIMCAWGARIERQADGMAGELRDHARLFFKRPSAPVHQDDRRYGAITAERSA